MENEIAVRQDMLAPLTAANISAQVQLVQQVMAEVMQGPSKDNPNGVHYGIIPGCGNKRSLFKAGAEKLFMTFRLRPIIDPHGDIVITDLPNGHRDYRVHSHILNMQGVEMATGVGSASTMESKYRYRGGKRKCPQCGAEAIIKGREEYGGGYICFGKKGGCGAKFADNDKDISGQEEVKSENPDIADVYNTVLKMACKRSRVDGCITGTACSDIFTQDLDEDGEADPPAKPAPAPHTPPQRKSQQGNPTAEELAAIAEKAKAAYHEGKAPKSEPANPQAPATGLETATGFLVSHGEPNAGGFVSWEMDNQQREDGKQARFASKDATTNSHLAAAMESGIKVSITYKPAENPRFAHNIMSVDEAKAEAKA